MLRNTSTPYPTASYSLFSKKSVAFTLVSLIYGVLASYGIYQSYSEGLQEKTSVNGALMLFALTTSVLTLCCLCCLNATNRCTLGESLNDENQRLKGYMTDSVNR